MKHKQCNGTLFSDGMERVCDSCQHTEDDNVKIRYWEQETVEFGRWVESKLVPRKTAMQTLHLYPSGEIVELEPIK